MLHHSLEGHRGGMAGLNGDLDHRDGVLATRRSETILGGLGDGDEGVVVCVRIDSGLGHSNPGTGPRTPVIGGHRVQRSTGSIHPAETGSGRLVHGPVIKYINNVPSQMTHSAPVDDQCEDTGDPARNAHHDLLRQQGYFAQQQQQLPSHFASRPSSSSSCTDRILYQAHADQGPTSPRTVRPCIARVHRSSCTCVRVAHSEAPVQVLELRFRLDPGDQLLHCQGHQGSTHCRGGE